MTPLPKIIEDFVKQEFSDNHKWLIGVITKFENHKEELLRREALQDSKTKDNGR